MNLIIDKPIEKSNEDRLGRVEFSKSLAKMLLTTKNDDGIVILLNGKWGSGKTSVINMVKEQIGVLCRENIEIQFAPIIHDFSPWNVINQEGIIAQFFDTFSSGFTVEKIKKALRAIQKSKLFQTTFKTLNYIPFINTNPVWQAISSLKKKFDDYEKSFNKNENLLERKEQIIDALRKSFTRHIVFIDDLDRLNDDEIKLVIQLVKSVCDFPNVIYVLSADYNVISGAIANEQKGNSEGEKYLEKIIQATFDIPNAKREKILEIAIQDLNKLFENRLSDEEVNRFQSYRFDGLLNSLDSLRDEKRFINLLSVAIDSYIDELDIADFIAITYLKLKNPKIIQILLDYSDHLFEHYSSYYDRNADYKNLEEKFKKELTDVYKDDSIYRIIKEMFPRMFSSYYDDKELYLSKRICSRQRFNLYLTQQLDLDDLSICRFENAILSRNYDDLVSFSKTLSKSQGRKFLLLLVNFVSKSNSIAECDFILKFLIEDLSSVGIEDVMFLVSKDYYVRDFIKELCKKYGSSETYSLLKKYVNESSDIYSLSELAIELNIKDENEKHSYGFTEEQIKELTETVCDLIMKRIKDNNLNLPKKARGIRLVFNHQKEKIKEFFDSANDLDKVCFLCDLIWIGSMTDKKTHLTYIYSIDWVNYLISDDSLQQIIKNNFNLLRNRDKQRILILLMQNESFESSEKLDGEKAYLCEDVTKYCLLKSIDFVGDDKYEQESNN